ncbi:Protein slit [Papilio xuthus]|uniref:Protein slit n=1 Tax=Papilio xuthus TaxID=66420 RepID=A0A194QB54_PAPXU|nr:Protein slit [Papilio xuthus]
MAMEPSVTFRLPKFTIAGIRLANPNGGPWLPTPLGKRHDLIAGVRMRGAVLSVLCALSAVLLVPGIAAVGAGSCPWACACRPGALDCAHRGLLHAPRRLPSDAHRLDLQGNNLTIIFQSDFQNLNDLKILQLSENQIHTIERDAFLALTSLERLKLNNNRIGQLPDGIFMKLKHLLRL